MLDGSARMRERPIQDLIEGLQQLDVHVQCSPTGCPPVELYAEGLCPGQVASGLRCISTIHAHQSVLGASTVAMTFLACASSGA